MDSPAFRKFRQSFTFFALILVVVLTVGSTAFGAQEPVPVDAWRGTELGAEEFRTLSTELERDYQKLFKLLDDSVQLIAKIGREEEV